jgi:hypothetical protein
VSTYCVARKNNFSFTSKIKNGLCNWTNNKKNAIPTEPTENRSMAVLDMVITRQERKIHTRTSEHGHKQKVCETCMTFLELIIKAYKA